MHGSKYAGNGRGPEQPLVYWGYEASPFCKVPARPSLPLCAGAPAAPGSAGAATTGVRDRHESCRRHVHEPSRMHQCESSNQNASVRGCRAGHGLEDAVAWYRLG